MTEHEPPRPMITVADFIAAVAKGRPQDEKNLVRILKIIAPAITGQPDSAPCLEDGEFQAFTASTPAIVLLDCLGKDGKWTPELVTAIPSLATIKSYKDDYRRCLARCLEHATATRLISASARGVSPDWQSARAELDAILPYNQKRLRARLAAGESELHGHTLTRVTERATHQYFRSLLDGLNVFARYMTSLGVTRPQDVRPEHFYGQDASFYNEVKRRNPQAQTAYYRTGYAWRILGALKPEWQLAEVPDAKKEHEYGLKQMPENLQAFREEAAQTAAAQSLSDSTISNFKEHIKRLGGFLKHELGLDLEALDRHVDDPELLGFLLCGGYPVLEGEREVPPMEEVRRIFEDPAYCDALLLRIRRVNRAHEAKESCRPNPILVLYKDWHLARGTASSLEVGLKASRLMSQHYLRTHKTQRNWKSELINETVKAKKRQPQSARARRKMLVGTQRELWLEMVAARPKIAAYTESLRQKMEAAIANPKRKDNQKAEARERYAVAVRNELMVGLLLAFQLRKENIQGIKIGEGIFPAEYKILLPPEGAKGDKPILKRFPEKGPFADLRALLDTYVTEARPIILGNRNETPYCFLSLAQGETDPTDEEGHLRVGREHLSRVMKDVCRRHFSEILPPELDFFNVHLARDLLVGYVYGKEDGEALICQALNNTPETARRHYNNISSLDDTLMKEFIENVDVSKAAKGRTGARKSREELRKKLARELGPDADPRLVNRLMRVVDVHG